MRRSSRPPYWSPPRPSQHLYWLWHDLARAADRLHRRWCDRHGESRLTEWWFWSGPGDWLASRQERAEQRWLRVKYAPAMARMRARKAASEAGKEERDGV